MKVIGVTANCAKPRAPEVLARLSGAARSLGFELVTCDETADLLPGSRSLPQADFVQSVDVLMALGGDGTMLHAARILDGHDIPVIGVNLGSLGFMTSVTDGDLEFALESLRGGQFTFSRRTVAEAALWRNGQSLGAHRALNDIVIGWGETSRVVTLNLTLDDEGVGTYICDGLILSTPTGSTGHSLSAGGPILLPESPVFVLNPICPHTLSNRPLVVPDRCTIEITVVDSSKRQLFVVDGQDHQKIMKGDRVAVRRAATGIRFVHLPGYSYFSLLTQKLHWRASNI